MPKILSISYKTWLSNHRLSRWFNSVISIQRDNFAFFVVKFWSKEKKYVTKRRIHLQEEGWTLGSLLYPSLRKRYSKIPIRLCSILCRSKSQTLNGAGSARTSDDITICTPYPGAEAATDGNATAQILFVVKFVVTPLPLSHKKRRPYRTNR